MKAKLNVQNEKGLDVSLFARSCDSVTNLFRRKKLEFKLFVSKQFISQWFSIHDLVNFLSHKVLDTQIHFLNLIRSEFLFSLQINWNFKNHNLNLISGFVLMDSSGEKIDLPTGGEDYLGKDI